MKLQNPLPEQYNWNTL